MPIRQLNDLSDARLNCFRDIQSHRTKDAEDALFIAEGRHCVRSLAQSSLPTHAVLVQSGREQEIASWFSPQTNLYVLPADQLHQVVGFEFHRGVIACGVRPPNADWVHHDEIPELALALCGVSDRDNLGSICRTGAALGVRHLICDQKTADPFSRRVIRVSMANVLGLQIHRCDDLLPLVRQMATRSGCRTLATTLKPNATPIEAIQLDDRPTLLMLGSEADGLDWQLEQTASDRVTIQMASGVDSLNVSIAAALFLYQLRRMIQIKE